MITNKMKNKMTFLYWRHLLCAVVVSFFYLAGSTVSAQPYYNLYEKWAKKTAFSGSQGWSKVRDVFADSNGNIYVTGVFSGKVNFGGEVCNPLTVADIGVMISETTTLAPNTNVGVDARNRGSYIVKFDANGIFQWRSYFYTDNATAGNLDLNITAVPIGTTGKVALVTNTNLGIHQCPLTFYAVGATHNGAYTPVGTTNFTYQGNSNGTATCTDANDYKGTGGYFQLNANGTIQSYDADKGLTEGNKLQIANSGDVLRSYFHWNYKGLTYVGTASYNSGTPNASGRNSYHVRYNQASGARISDANEGYYVFDSRNVSGAGNWPNNASCSWSTYNAVWDQIVAPSGAYLVFLRRESGTDANPNFTSYIVRASTPIPNAAAHYTRQVLVGWDNSDTPVPVMATDDNSNLYAGFNIKHNANNIQGLATYGAGSNFYSAVKAHKAVLMKFNTNLDIQWSFQIGNGGMNGSTSDNSTSRITSIQRYDDRIYVTGNFKGTVNFNPRGAVNSQTSTGSDGDGFYAVYDTDGYLWRIIIFSGSGNESIDAMTASTTDGSVLLAGSYNSSLFNVDPNGGTSNSGTTKPKLSGDGNTSQSFVGKYCINAACIDAQNYSYGDAKSSFGLAAHTIYDCLRINGLASNKIQATPNQTLYANTAKNDDGIGANLLVSRSVLPPNNMGYIRYNGTNIEVTVNIVNTGDTPAKLVGWIDFNNNGVFDPSEASTNIQTITTTSASGSYSTIYWSGKKSSMPLGASYYMRLRLTTDNISINEPAGLATNGEVEDYLILTAENDYSSVEKGKTVNVSVLGNDGLSPYLPSNGTITIVNTSLLGGSVTVDNTNKTINYTAGTTTGVAYVDYQVTCSNDGGATTNMTNAARLYIVVHGPNPATVCWNASSGNSISMTAITDVTYKWYANASGGSSLATGNQLSGLSTATIGSVDYWAEGSFYDSENGHTELLSPRVKVTFSVERCIQANPDAAVASYQSPVTIPVLNNDNKGETGYNPSNGSVTYVSGADLTKGTITINNDNTISYQPTATFHGTHTFTYRLTVPDGLGGTKTSDATVTITVIKAEPDSRVTNTTTAINIPVLTNDDLGGKTPASVTVVSGPAKGSVTPAAGNTFIYTPDPDFPGTYTFTYRVTVPNEQGGSSYTDAVVTIDVIEAQPDYGITNTETPKTIAVLTNDVLCGKTPTSVVVTTPPSKGATTVNGDNTITYTPGTNDPGTYTYTYTVTVSDGSGGYVSTPAEVTIDVIKAIDDSRSTVLGLPVNINVLPNDVLCSKTVTAVDFIAGSGSGTAGGTVSAFIGTLDNNGYFTYTPAAVGTYSFRYRVTVEGGTTTEATVTITVTSAPVDIDAVNDYAITKPGEDVVIPVLDNDDPNGHTVTVTIPDGSGGNTLKDPGHGTVTKNPDGTFTYDPTDPVSGEEPWTGVDDFEYEISYPVDPGNPTGEKVTDKATVYVVILDPQHVRICEGVPANTIMKANPSAINRVTFYWYNDATGTTAATGDASHLYTLDVSRNGYGVERRWVKVHYSKIEGGEHVFPDFYQATATFVPNLMYWKKTAADNNWNNPANWVKEDGSPFGFDCVPWKCTVVHIPGNANKYPSLESSTTDRSTLAGLFDGAANRLPYNEGKGTPCCSDIIYHFGGEVAKPHYLDYNRAFVHYNFGRNIQADKTLFACGDASSEAVGTHSASFLARDRYYAMAAPLKEIVTGDFSLGGFPKMLQQGFKTSRNAGAGGDTGLSGSWYLPNGKMNLKVGANMNYAISLKSYGYDASVAGMSNHTNLNALNGCLVLPYFEGPDEIESKIEPLGSTLPGKAHRLHWFAKTASNPLTGTSHYHYYYDKDLRMANLSDYHDTHSRTHQSYRFIFEGTNDVPVENFVISVPADGTNEVMVGNPFISSLNIGEFMSVNSSRLVSDTYRLYKNGLFETQSPGDADYDVVAPLQAIFVQPVEGAGDPKETGLIFTKAMSITRATNASLQLKSSAATDLLTVRATNAIGSSRAVLGFSNPMERKSIDRMFSNDVPGMPQVYLLHQDQKKEILYLSGRETVIPLGIRSNSSEEFTLSFENVSNLPVESLQLKDKELGRTIDLLQQDSYTFRNQSGNLADRFELIIKNVVTGMDDIDQAQVRIYAKDHVLHAVSDREIVEIQITNIQGIRIVAETLPGVLQYSKELTVAPGAYIVTVKVNNGETKTEKVVMK